MLRGKVEVIIFEESIHEDDEFAHNGGKGDEGFFTAGAQAEVKFFKDGFVTDSAQGSHVESATDCFTATGDMTRTGLATAVLIVGSDSRQGGSGGAAQRAQLGHLGQDGGTGSRADTGDGFQTFGFAAEGLVVGDDPADFLITLIDLSVQEFKQLAGLFGGKAFSVMFGAVGFPYLEVDELASPSGQLQQLSLLRTGCRGRFRGESLAVLSEDSSINGISFGAQAFGFGKIANPPSFEDGDGDGSGLENPHNGLFIPTSSFTDHLSLRMGTQEFEEFGVTFWIVGQAVGMIGQVQFQRELGNIQADIEDREVVLTHTCKIRATAPRGRRAQATVRV